MNKEVKVAELLGEFRKQIDEVFIGETPKITGELDELYDCDIYIYRHPGMGNSKQIIMGSPLSIFTATASYLETLLRQKVINEEELLELVKTSIKAAKGGFEEEK